MTQAQRINRWNQLLGPLAKELIVQAHKDARKGLHHSRTEMNTQMTGVLAVDGPQWNTISKIECACGCHTLLSQKTADRGWTVIRGHSAKKLRLGHHVAGRVLVNKVHAPHMKAPITVSEASIEQYCAASLELIEKQMNDYQRQVDFATNAMDKLRKDHKKFIAVKELLKSS